MPDWALMFDDETEVDAARERWRVIVIEQAERGLLDSTSGALIQRAVTLGILFDRASREVAANGSVIKPKRSSARSISRVSPHFVTMTKLGKELLFLEGHLGMTPATRGRVTRAEARQRRRSAADEFLKIVK
ncbi:phage terminase small subunit [Bradyrhizobium niftali]|uniref:P27 family phage terminase small subunit n=1 Tax=Bradyrhizobium niftali TaxID=2560055 RepID=UPI0038379013